MKNWKKYVFVFVSVVVLAVGFAVCGNFLGNSKKAVDLVLGEKIVIKMY